MTDIRAGLSNDEIRRKYKLSEKGTRSLLDKLLSVNLLTGEEHARRIGSMPRSTNSAGDNGGRPARNHVIARSSVTPVTTAQPHARLQYLGEGPGSSTRNRASAELASQFSQDRPEICKGIVAGSTDFIDVSDQGENQWWRYLVSILFILLVSPALSAIVALVLGAFLSRTTTSFVGAPFLSYVRINIDFVFLFGTMFLVIRLEHRRPFLSLITRNRSIDWKKIGKSFGIFGALLSLVLVVDFLLDPEEFRFSLNPGRFLLFAPVAFVLTPIQIAAEELLFRGYLLQMMALLTRNRFLLVLSSALLFMLPHLLNPEVASGFVPMSLYYCAIGGFLTLVTLKSNGLEVAMGIHAAVNLFVLLIVNHSNSVLKSESIFFSTAPFNPVASLVSFCVVAAVFYLLMFGKVSPHSGFALLRQRKMLKN